MAFKPFERTTVDDIISSYKDEAITEGSIAFKEKINGEIVIKFHNILSKYHDLMKKYIVTVDLTEDEYAKYKCLPNLMSYDLYGTPELGYSLLYINNMVSVTDFTKRTVNVFTTNIGEVLKEMMVLLKDDLDSNYLRLFES